jgi:hypothetical protein
MFYFRVIWVATFRHVLQVLTIPENVKFYVIFTPNCLTFAFPTPPASATIWSHQISLFHLHKTVGPTDDRRRCATLDCQFLFVFWQDAGNAVILGLGILTYRGSVRIKSAVDNDKVDFLGAEINGHVPQLFRSLDSKVLGVSWSSYG